MSRPEIILPGVFDFSCHVPVRITDLNYGNHVGNDAMLSLIHEARMQYLSSAGYTELSFAGAGLIMTDATLLFKAELFYGDQLVVSVHPTSISNVGFDLVYKLEKEDEGKMKLVATAKTGMLCYDYTRKKIVTLPVEARNKLLERG
jgi:acyl-CoA thioester hydrolase